MNAIVQFISEFPSSLTWNELNESIYKYFNVRSTWKPTVTSSEHIFYWVDEFLSRDTTNLTELYIGTLFISVLLYSGQQTIEPREVDWFARYGDALDRAVCKTILDANPLRELSNIIMEYSYVSNDVETFNRIMNSEQPPPNILSIDIYNQFYVLRFEYLKTAYSLTIRDDEIKDNLLRVQDDGFFVLLYEFKEENDDLLITQLLDSFKCIIVIGTDTISAKYLNKWYSDESTAEYERVDDNSSILTITYGFATFNFLLSSFAYDSSIDYLSYYSANCNRILEENDCDKLFIRLSIL